MRAGGVPYHVNGEEITVCLFVSNDPAYGGEAPQIAKGHLEPGEFPVEAAAREVFEETGIAVSPHSGWLVSRFDFEGQLEDYVFWCYAFPVETMQAPAVTDEGTGVWMSIDEAIDSVRRAHLQTLLALREALA